MRDTPYSWIEKFNTVTLSRLCTVNYRFMQFQSRPSGAFVCVCRVQGGVDNTHITAKDL